MNISSNYSFVNIAMLDEHGRLKAAYLVMESLPPYYKVEGIDKTEMASAVAVMLGETTSKIEGGFAALCGNQVVGVLSFIGAEKLPASRLVGTQKLLKRLSPESVMRFRENLRNYNADYGNVPSESLYLNRIAIDKDYRGTGLAGRMMERFLSLNKFLGEKQTGFSLHVDRNNERAIAFYRKFGFTSNNCESQYLTMIRN